MDKRVPAALVTGKWFRRPYYVERGYVKPVPGTDCEDYDPFDAYFDQRYPRQGQSLHVALQALNGATDRKIADFCSNWGLLGILQDRVVQYRWPMGDRAGQYDLPGIGYGRALGMSTVIWLTEQESGSRRLDPTEDRNVPTVLVECGGGRYEERLTTDYCARFFPDTDLGALNELTLRQTVVFDETLYCEPLDLFRGQVSRLATFAQDLVNRKPRPLDLWSLNCRVRRVHQALVEEGNTYGREWRFPSLISALYMMLVMDASGGRLLLCQHCGNAFTSARPDRSLYCTDRCRSTAKKRQQRKNKAEREAQALTNQTQGEN